MPGGNKEGGGLESTYKMKNSMLHKGAKHGAPVQMNYGSPTKVVTGEVTVDGGKGGKSTDQRNYEKKLENKASKLYVKDRASRTGGTDFSTADEKTRNKYKALAQKS